MPAFAIGVVTAAKVRRHHGSEDPLLLSEPYISSVEDLARIAGHARRSPDTRLLFPLLRRISAHFLLQTAKVATSQLRTRLVEAAKNIGIELPAAGDVAEIAEQMFQESESLTGVLQYRHGAYRKRWEGRLSAGDEAELVQAYRDLYAHRLTIGALGDGARMVTGLPHAHLAFDRVEFGRSLATLQLAPVERWRSRLRWAMRQ